MSESYSKNYFEKYAALTLTHIFNIKENDIVQSDRPDLKIPTLNFGIEVTQALTPQEAVADMKKPLYASLDMNPFDDDTDSMAFVMEKIDNAIKRKIEKSQNYTVYQNNGLYIFSHCHNIEESLLRIYLESLSYQDFFFRYIFINCVTDIYCFDYQKKKLSSIHFHKSDLIAMNIKSLIYEKTCSKKRRKIIISKTS
ncbi:MAG: hypothetical protein ACLUVC_13455 [Longibaculum sp.]